MNERFGSQNVGKRDSRAQVKGGEKRKTNQESKRDGISKTMKKKRKWVNRKGKRGDIERERTET